ncbi:MAG: helix-turn-helix transcriptional regulator [Prolixibacteraceae bacterium]|nr:helix-turn-helix transcriptional regulator [Prolixibacteraceae bacterium]
MAIKNNTDVKTDPSMVKQHFTDINLKVHCCRYWKLYEWEFQNLSLPFWRLYANNESGAMVHFGNRSFSLGEGKILLIPPYTSFSTSLKSGKGDRLSGSRIESSEELKNLKSRGMVDHLFIHFNLGFRFDQPQPQIFEFDADNAAKQLLNQVRTGIVNEYQNPSFKQSLKIHSLILSLLSELPKEVWNMKSTDKRVLRVIDYIERHIGDKLPNEELAETGSMAVNSFLRLFKSTTGSTLQQFIQNKRIEKALVLMHNPSLSIEQIAGECGFSDRQHFSKVFKRVVNISPAQYRKSQAM